MAALSIKGTFDGKELVKGINDVKKEIGGLSSSADTAQKSLSDMLQTKNSTTNYRQQLGQLSKQLTDLTVNYRMLSDAERASASGQEMAAKITDLTAKAQMYKDAIGDVQKSISVGASDTLYWDALGQATDIASSSIQAFAGIAGLSKGTVEALTKAIAAMKTVEAAFAVVKKITNALQKESAIYQAASAVQTKVCTAAIASQTKATVGAAVAQRALNTAMKANPVGLIIAGITALVTALSLVVSKHKEQKKAAEEAAEAERQAAETSKKKWEDYWEAQKDALDTRSADQKALDDINSKIRYFENQRASYAKAGNTKLWEKENGDKLEIALKRRAQLEENIAKSQKTTSTQEEKLVKNSVAWYDAKIAEQQKLVNATDLGTDAYKKQVQVLEDLKKAKDTAIGKASRQGTSGLGDLPSLNVGGGVTIKAPEVKLNTQPAIDQLAAFEERYKATMDAVNAYSDVLGSVASAISSVGSCLGETGQKWAQFGANVIQTVAKILPQIVSLVTANEAASLAEGTSSAAALPFPANMVAIASVVAEIVALFASFPKFATGGIVGGVSRTGDMNLVRVNSGEMILNGRQQANLFRMLNEGRSTTAGTGIGTVEWRIQGSDLVGCIDNYNKRKGRI